MSEKLKPCPFCGASDQVHFSVDRAWHNTFVRCWKCNATGPWQYGDMDETESAVAAWNRCAPSADKAGVAAVQQARAEGMMDASWLIWEKIIYTAAQLKTVKRCREAMEAAAQRIYPGAKAYHGRPKDALNAVFDGTKQVGE